MSVDWPIVKLEDIVEITSSKRVKRADYVDEGIPFFRSKEVIEKSKGNNISTELFITPEHFESIRSKFGAPVEGDILLTSVGTLGVPYQVQGSDQFYFKDGNLTWFRKFSNKVKPRFLYYWLTSPLARRKFDEITIGSTQKALTIVALKSIQLALPSESEQDNLIKILDSLSLKLANNRQTNQTLESIAQAIFKSWFVDFEPTRAKIVAKQAGQDPERAAMAAISGKALEELSQLSSSQLEQLKKTAALFPDEVDDSELGEVPEGWNISPLTSVAEIIMGQSPKGDTYNDAGIGTPLVNGPVEFGNYHTKKIKWTTAPTRMSTNRDLIVCVRGSTTGRLVKSNGEYCLGRGVCAVRSVNFQPYVDYLFKSEITKLLSLTTGSTFPSWNGPVLKNYRIIQPSDDVLGAFTSHIESLEFKISSTEVEIERLSALRDTLLPKLLSGELEIPTKNTEAEVA